VLVSLFLPSRIQTPADTDGNRTAYASSIPTNGHAVKSLPSMVSFCKIMGTILIADLYAGQAEPNRAATPDNSKNHPPGKARRIWRCLNLFLGTRHTSAADISVTGSSSLTAVNEKTKQYVKFLEMKLMLCNE
jgi:hypothetical protein